MRVHLRAASLIGLAAWTYAAALRPRLLNWGASEQEVQGRYPGAGLIGDGRRGGTMATTIEAPPARVWPWLTQMGCDRAGWYSWDRLDNGGLSSAWAVHEEWQSLAVGDRLASTPRGDRWFQVAAVDPERFLALRAPLSLGGHPFDPAGPRPRFYVDSVWCFSLSELGGGRTRLLVSGYAASRPRALTAPADVLFWEPAHCIMQARQLANLKRRAESGGLPALEPLAGELAGAGAAMAA